jgi:hypothetical protein
MPIVSFTHKSPIEDGRQSARALSVRLGVERYFEDLSWVSLPEMSLKNGRRADIVTLSPSGQIGIVEVKSSIADFNADQKWHEYLEYCDYFWFATLPDVPADIFPMSHGFLVADHHGCEVLRIADNDKLSSATRKAMQLRFARASAARLARCRDHFGSELDQITGLDKA